MAQNYIKVSQKPALILGTAGPGALNLVESTAELYLSQLPAIIITPTVSTSIFGKNCMQDDSGYGSSYSCTSIFSNITKKSVSLVDKNAVATILQDLLRRAFTPPYGPVHLSIPSNMLLDTIDINLDFKKSYRTDARRFCEQEKIDKVADQILKSKNPLLFIGGRCVYPNCSDEIEKFANQFNIPYVTCHGSKGIVDEHSPLFQGINDVFGHRSSEKYIKESDLIIALGHDFNEFSTIKYDPELFENSNIISIDHNLFDIGINYPIFESVYGDIGFTLTKLGQCLTELNYSNNITKDQLRENFARENSAQLKQMSNTSGSCNVFNTLHQISCLLHENDVVFADIGSAGFATLRHMTVGKKSYYSSQSNYSMGHAVAGCIGGKLANPDCMTICIAGDGAFLMYSSEVLTATQYGIGITWIIFKEGYYNLIESNQRLIYGGALEYCTKHDNPNFKELAKAYGVEYFDVKNVEDLKKAIPEAREMNIKNESVIITIEYDFRQSLPIKPRVVQAMKDYSQVNTIQSAPNVIKSLGKIFKERV